MNRRTVSSLLVVGCSALVAGVVGIPVLVSGISPGLKSRQQSWRPVGDLSNFSTGRVTCGTISADQDAWPRTVGAQTVFVWRRSAEDLVVFSRSCTDLSCPLEYEPGSGCFLCPCHGGIFAPDGRRLAGPASAPMHRYAHRIREEVLEIDIASIPPAS